MLYPRFLSAVLSTVGILAVLGFVSLDGAALHTRLVSSEPAADDTLTEKPARVYLVFSAAINPRLTQVTLRSGARDRTLTVLPDPDSDRAVAARTPDLGSGEYRVAWRTTSDDGHTVSGEFTFVLVLPEPTEAPEEPVIAPPPTQPSQTEGGTSATSTGSLLSLLRGLGVGTLLAFAGLSAFVGFYAPGAGSRPRALARWLAWLAPVALAASLAGWLGSLLPGSAGPDAMAAGFGTTVGKLEIARLTFAVAALAALLADRSFKAAAALALIGVVLTGAIGHAAVFAPAISIPLKAVHLIAVALWLGGLLMLAADDVGAAGYSTQASRVSAIALVSVIVIAVTGLIMTYLFVPSLGALTASAYGRGITLKIGGLAALMAFGAYHRKKSLPGLSGAGGPVHLRSAVRLETAVMIAVILAAGFLARISPPESLDPPRVAETAALSGR